jgi:hypothetical protein
MDFGVGTKTNAEFVDDDMNIENPGLEDDEKNNNEEDEFEDCQ